MVGCEKPFFIPLLEDFLSWMVIQNCKSILYSLIVDVVWRLPFHFLQSNVRQANNLY